MPPGGELWKGNLYNRLDIMGPLELGYKVVLTSQCTCLISKIAPPHFNELRGYKYASQMAFSLDHLATRVISVQVT